MAEQNKAGMNDDPRQAREEGDPKETGRSRGHVVDENDPQGPSRTDPDKTGSKPGEKSSEGAEHWESGRQRAN